MKIQRFTFIVLLSFVQSVQVFASESSSDFSEEFSYGSEDSGYDNSVSPLKRSASIPLEELEELSDPKKAKISCEYEEGQSIVLLDLPNDVLKIIVERLQRMDDQIAFAQTCRLSRALVNSFPHAPCNFRLILPLSVHPEIKHEITVEDFIDQFRLNTVAGRRQFCSTFTTQNFSVMLNAEHMNGYLLKQAYLDLVNVVRGLIGIGFYITVTDFCYMLPFDIFNHVTTEVRFSGLGMVVLPPEIGKSKLLEKLTLRNNLLRFLPDEFCKLKAMKNLEITKSNLMSLPNNFSALENISVLCLSGGLLKFIPESILSLPNLMDLNLSDNWITNVPYNISNLKKLKKLNLSNNAENVKAMYRFGEELDARNSFADLPPTFMDLLNLVELNLSCVGLKIFPDRFHRLNNLTTLNVSHNNLEDVPEALLHMTNLKILNIGHNQIHVLTPKISRMSGLERLNIVGNGLDKLPSELGEIPSLVYLNIKKNNIPEIPDVLRKKGGLRIIGAIWHGNPMDVDD